MINIYLWIDSSTILQSTYLVYLYISEYNDCRWRKNKLSKNLIRVLESLFVRWTVITHKVAGRVKTYVRIRYNGIHIYFVTFSNETLSIKTNVGQDWRSIWYVKLHQDKQFSLYLFGMKNSNLLWPALD